jgi:hypothetical protein
VYFFGGDASGYTRVRCQPVDAVLQFRRFCSWSFVDIAVTLQISAGCTGTRPAEACLVLSRVLIRC